MIKSLTDSCYGATNRGPLRVLSLVMALVLAGCVFWMPARFATGTSALTPWHNIIIVWAVCAGVIHGVGFTPRRWGWRLLFLPAAAMLALAGALLYAFS